MKGQGFGVGILLVWFAFLYSWRNCNSQEI